VEDSKLKLTPNEVEEIKDDAVFKYKVISALKTLDNLPCGVNITRMWKIEKCIEGIKTQVYFQWAVLGILLVIIKVSMK